MRCVESPTRVEIDTMTAAERRELLAEVDLIECRTAIVRSRLLAAEEATRSFREDGFRTVTQMVAATSNVPTGVAQRQVRLARALADLPLVEEALWAGNIGVEQALVIAGLHANPQCRPHLAAAQTLLSGHGETLAYDDFVRVGRRFRELADPDGSAAQHETTWKRRRLSSAIVDDAWQLRVFGDGLTAAEFEATLAIYTQTELERDWAACRARYGDDACGALLGRTHQQRRFDAFAAMMHAAAGQHPRLRGHPLVNIVCDEATVHDAIRRAAGLPVVPADPVDEFAFRRCETSTGHAVSPQQLFQSLLHSRVRAVIVDAHTRRPVAAGRKRRLFTGIDRDLIRLADAHCTGPGCTVHPLVSEIDHVVRHRHGGETIPSNGRVLCGHDNREKERRRFTTTVDASGQVRTWRADGTEIAPRGRNRRPPPASGPDPPPQAA